MGRLQVEEVKFVWKCLNREEQCCYGAVCVSACGDDCRLLRLLFRNYPDMPQWILLAAGSGLRGRDAAITQNLCQLPHICVR